MQYLFLQLFPANEPALADFASFIFETPDMVAAKSTLPLEPTREETTAVVSIFIDNSAEASRI